MSGDYEIGYCRPPKETRYKKGKSGNPRGRPRDADDPRKAMYRALARRVSFQENGRRRRATMVELLVRGILQHGIRRGNPQALSIIMEMIERFQPKPGERKREVAQWTEEDIAMEKYIFEDVPLESHIEDDAEVILPPEGSGGAQATPPPPQ